MMIKKLKKAAVCFCLGALMLIMGTGLLGCGEVKSKIVPDVSDLTGLNSYEQESETDYRMIYKPKEADGYVGDVMPYYENGVFSIFYLKDEGGSLRHSVYRVDTKDFLTYEDKGEVLTSRSIYMQDFWIGTGSVVKADNDYYFFYTGHNPGMNPWEKVMVAKSVGNMDNFVRVDDFEIAPSQAYNQRDFRDPQVFYNEEKQVFDISVETNSNSVAHMVKYTVSKDLKTVTEDGIFFSDNDMGFWNMECMDIVKVKDKYFMTYSGQNDTVWYTYSDSMFANYVKPKRLEGKVFYAPKTVEDDKGNIYLIGWASRKREPIDTADLYWGGHLMVHKMVCYDDGSVKLFPINDLDKYYGYNAQVKQDKVSFSLSEKSLQAIGDGKESYMVKGKFKFTGNGKFGLVLGLGGDKSEYRHIGYSAANKKLYSCVSNGISEVSYFDCVLAENKEYEFLYYMEGSVGVFYIIGEGALSTRIYGAGNQQFGVFSENTKTDFYDIKYQIRSKNL